MSDLIMHDQQLVTPRYDSGPKKKLTQWERVLHYMLTHECITSMIAFSELNITSLHRRLTDIERNTDYVIDRKRIDVPNRPHHYEYRLL